MTYNIHPILVHFPIAFLFIYSIIKVLPFDKWFPNISWKNIRSILLFIGVLGACVSLITGDLAREMVNPNTGLVHMHSTFAYLSTWLYGALLLGEIVSVIKSKYSSVIQSEQIKALLTFLENILRDGLFSKLLALLGIISISITGMLGGVMVYGLSADPFAGIVLKILGINL